MVKVIIGKQFADDYIQCRIWDCPETKDVNKCQHMQDMCDGITLLCKLDSPTCKKCWQDFMGYRVVHEH